MSRFRISPTARPEIAPHHRQRPAEGKAPSIEVNYTPNSARLARFVESSADDDDIDIDEARAAFAATLSAQAGSVTG